MEITTKTRNIYWFNIYSNERKKENKTEFPPQKKHTHTLKLHWFSFFSAILCSRMRKERSILFVYVSFVFFFLLSQFVFIFVRFLVCLCHFWNSFKLTNMLFDRRHYLFSSKHTHIFNCECAHQFRTAKRDYSMDKHIAVSHFHTLSLAIKSMIHLYFLWFNVYTAFNEIWSIFNCGRRRMSMCVCVCNRAVDAIRSDVYEC